MEFTPNFETLLDESFFGDFPTQVPFSWWSDVFFDSVKTKILKFPKTSILTQSCRENKFCVENSPKENVLGDVSKLGIILQYFCVFLRFVRFFRTLQNPLFFSCQIFSLFSRGPIFEYHLYGIHRHTFSIRQLLNNCVTPSDTPKHCFRSLSRMTHIYIYKKNSIIYTCIDSQYGSVTMAWNGVNKRRSAMHSWCDRIFGGWEKRKLMAFSLCFFNFGWSGGAMDMS